MQLLLLLASLAAGPPTVYVELSADARGSAADHRPPCGAVDQTNIHGDSEVPRAPLRTTDGHEMLRWRHLFVGKNPVFVYMYESLYGSPPQLFFNEIAGFETNSRPCLLKYDTLCHPNVIVRWAFASKYYLITFFASNSIFPRVEGPSDVR